MKFKRAIRWVGWIFATLMVLLLLGAGMLWWSLHASLAQLDGRRHLAGLTAPVRVERDRLGVPTIYATNRLDATRALGFLHAQERFFQMDLIRRSGGGELSELFGALAVEHDREQRLHRPRAHAKRALEVASPMDAALLKAYAEGVNAGLEALTVRPPEYLALRSRPSRWQVEDTYLVAYAMFGDLHDINGNGDYRELALRQAFSPSALAFFNSPDIRWSAALDDSQGPTPPIPTPEAFTVSAEPAGNNQNSVASTDKEGVGSEPEPEGTIGSNNWAVDGRRSGTGAALVANDMHLGLKVPNTWYRVRLIYQDPQLGPQDVTGVTLPGTPVIVSGSNRHVAWANTASDLDVSDLVMLEFDPANPHRYRTPAGWRELQSLHELISVRGGTNVELTIEETIWGPVVSRGKQRYALASTVHEPEAVNLGLIEVERSRDVEAALHAGNLAGTPVNNFVVGDRLGHIGYSLLGRLPNRVGFDGAVPCSWADGSRGWQGWLPPEKYPRFMNPDTGILWSANNRTLGSPDYNALNVSPDNGARARQIRDALRMMDKPSEQTLWSIYSDDRALFLAPWQALMLSTMTEHSSTDASWQEARGYVQNWGGRAAVDSQGFRLVRAFRTRAMELLFEPVSQKLPAYARGMKIYNEDAAWAMLQAKPIHLLNPKFKTYEALLAEAVKGVLEELRSRHIPLAQATWGARNRLQIRHPLGYAVRGLSRWLDMPDVAVSGDSHMPKVHAPGSGVSERMIVSPGHEENGFYNMPCGQSGHFLSPFYRSEMDAWLKLQPQPFLPGKTVHVLELSY